MNNSEKSALFLALRAIERIEGYVGANMAQKMELPDLGDFIEKSWLSLIQSSKLKTAAKALHRKINSVALDEQDAAPEEVVSNYYLYAVADLAIFFSDGDPSSLESPGEWAMEVVRFLEMEKILGEPGNAVILTQEQLQEIEDSDLVVNELKAQEQDQKMVANVQDWTAEVLSNLRNISS
jgi:hypothetical protein